jgi:K+-transporting ATPase ATPase C chain
MISLLICGLLFPLLVTGLAQVLFPSQANGSITRIGSKGGSTDIAQDFTTNDTLGIFFHSRPSNMSASGVDPDITLEDALSQIPRISSVTGIPILSLTELVNQHVQRTFVFSGDAYVNVLQLNLALIQTFPYYQSHR